MLTQLKDLKKAYRAAYQELRITRDQVAAIQSSIDHAKQQLVTQFEDWYEENFDAKATTAK